MSRAPKFNGADIAWLLTSSALVLMMTIPGLALFYGGMVRRKNVLSTLMQSFILAAIVSIQWVLFGYSLAFAPGNAFIGGFAWLGLQWRQRRRSRTPPIQRPCRIRRT